MKWMPFIAAIVLGIFTAGCVTDFTVDHPAQKDALDQLMQRMENAVNPDRKPLPPGMRVKVTSVMGKLGITMAGEVICTMEPFRTCSVAGMPGMPRIIELYDGAKGWNIIEETSIKELDGAELMQLRFLGELNWVSDLRTVFSPLTLDQEPLEINGKQYLRLVGTPEKYPALGTMEFLVDPETALIFRSKYTVHSAFGKIPVENYSYDYRKFGSLMLPERTVSKTLGDEVVTTLLEVTPVSSVPPEMFDAQKWFEGDDK